ncbi:Uncharacterized protein dnm_052120 [Desulfonema magnum]|uniref:Uncharacterized protein n=1 Tax=Desulfonema magnum TaxID=45655 RepID=A0A975BPV4_9BACT|nr:Uncharacterized protein dnm_052120 [Desulfonema magnum]
MFANGTVKIINTGSKNFFLLIITDLGEAGNAPWERHVLDLLQIQRA